MTPLAFHLARTLRREAPLAALEDLLARATTGGYADWAAQMPSLDNPERTYAG